MDNNELVSIIVPIYNAEKFLNQCIESVINQLYTYWELLLIDDGSTDNSLEICNHYKNKLPLKIRIFHKKNTGVSDTRNFGIENSNGIWITFLDADDQLYDNFLFEAINLTNDFCDIICGSVEIQLNEKNSYLVRNKEKLYCGDEKIILIKSLLNGKNSKYLKAQLIGYSWAKLFKKTLIRNITFSNEIHYKEDTIFNIIAFKNSEWILTVPNIWYKYKINDTSASCEYYSNYSLEVKLYLTECCNSVNDIEDIDKEIKICALMMYINWLKLYLFHPQNNQAFKEKLKIIKYSFSDEIWKTFFANIDCSELSVPLVTLYTMIRMKFSFGIYILFTINRIKKQIEGWI